MLGYGGTDKPRESSAYVHSLLARDLVDILDHEQVTDVLAVGHDWGSKTASVLANLYSDRFLGFGFLCRGYAPPLTNKSIFELSQRVEETIGYVNFGYSEFYTSPDAEEVTGHHLITTASPSTGRPKKIRSVQLANYTIQKSVLFGGADKDMICTPLLQQPAIDQLCLYATSHIFNAGHWVMSAAAQEVNETLEKWVQSVAPQS